LAAAIIDRSPDSLCLSEPDSHLELMSQAASAQDFVARLSREFALIRRTILAGGSVPDRRRPDGAPLTNYFSDPLSDGRREAAFTIQNVSRRGLSADFVLGVKHNALYAAVLPEIIASARFRVVTVIRDPVAVIMSWRSLDLPISRGRLPAAERFWPELVSLGGADLDLTEKQFRICDLLLGRFLEWARRAPIVRYEELVADPARLLHAAGLATLDPVATSGLISPMLAARIGNRERVRLAARLRNLVATGEFRAIAELYPEYRPRREPLPDAQQTIAEDGAALAGEPCISPLGGL
jgi:hypothetical protein